MEIQFLVPQLSYESRKVKDELLALNGRTVKISTWDSINLPFKEYPKVLWVKFSPNIPIIYQLASIEDFEANGTRVVNSLVAIETCDKLSAYLLWRRALTNEFTMPRTLVTRDIMVAMDYVTNQDVVFKPINLGLGEGVLWLQNGPQLEKTLRKLLKRYGVLFLQEFIPNFGYDIRAIVVGEKNIIEYIRYNPKDFRYNVHLGGGIQTVDERQELNHKFIHQVRKIAVNIAHRTQLDMVGIDFLISKEYKLYVLEWNAFFNFQGVEKVLKVNIAREIAVFLDRLVTR
ncbi:MAG: ATP-grasp domain-containing protein [Candidatus Helarchaeota archaeon]